MTLKMQRLIYEYIYRKSVRPKSVWLNLVGWSYANVDCGTFHWRLGQQDWRIELLSDCYYKGGELLAGLLFEPCIVLCPCMQPDSVRPDSVCPNNCDFIGHYLQGQSKLVRLESTVWARLKTSNWELKERKRYIYHNTIPKLIGCDWLKL
jgi:hypothetical protein